VLIGYVLIPFLPNSITMYLTSVLLAGLAGTYYMIWDRRLILKPAVPLCLLAELAFLGIGAVQERRPHFAEVQELYRANSNFGLVQVVQNKRGDRRFYMNDYLIQNIYDPTEKKSLALFTYALHDLALAYTPRVEKALCIGLGVGIVPSQLAREGVQVDVVEINPAVVPVAVHHFDCETNRLHLVIGDGRYFINECTNRYDTVIVDAFLGDSSPAHLMTRQAFLAVKRLLNPNGTLVMNTFGEFEMGKDFFSASLQKTLRQVFRSVRIHASGNGNVFFVSSDRAPMDMLKQPDLDRIHVACRHEASAAFNGIVQADPEHGIVLTDDYNPVEFYDAATREEHRKRLASYMRSL
jgi:spermidine synthase